VKLLKDGKFILANNIKDGSCLINGMYVAYGPSKSDAEPDADLDYFKELARQDGRGYARIAITGSELKKDGTLVFSGMLTPEDLKGSPVTADTVLTTATLVHMPDGNPVNDLFAYSVVLKNNIKIVPGTYIVVNVGIKIGE
jgi:hypothetical protein